MAECMDEFDEATPLRESYCSRLTTDQYEEQAASFTEQALRGLMGQLDGQPELYKSVMKKRRREEKEGEGLVSYLKVRLWSLVGAEESVSDLECQEEICKLKTNIMKAHTYSQENRGRRYSLRLAEKRRSTSSTPVRGRTRIVAPPPPSPAPPAPPPPPPPPVTTAAASTCVSYRRRPLAEKNTTNTRQLRRQLATDRGDLQSILGQLSGSGCRKRLRATAARSPGGTPLTGWGSKKVLTPEGVRVFNQLLVDKFRNVKTPPSPYPGRQASPGTFDSPL